MRLSALALMGDGATPGGSGTSGRARLLGSNNYRPQFAASFAPAGFHDEEFVHYYDAVSNPALGLTLAAGASLRDIPLPLETDAAFIARGIRFVGTGMPNLQVREPGGRYLSQDALFAFQSYLSGGLFVLPSGAFEVMTVALEPEIECPAGSVFLAYFENSLAVPLAMGVEISIFGVKRYADACKH